MAASRIRDPSGLDRDLLFLIVPEGKMEDPEGNEFCVLRGDAERARTT